jgi:hypothetical protein
MGAALRGEVRRMSPCRSERDHISAEPAPSSGISAALTTVCRGAGMILVVFLAYGGWVLLPIAAIAALIALMRCT